MCQLAAFWPNNHTEYRRNPNFSEPDDDEKIDEQKKPRQADLTVGEKAPKEIHLQENKDIEQVEPIQFDADELNQSLKISDQNGQNDIFDHQSDGDEDFRVTRVLFEETKGQNSEQDTSEESELGQVQNEKNEQGMNQSNIFTKIFHRTRKLANEVTSSTQFTLACRNFPLYIILFFMIIIMLFFINPPLKTTSSHMVHECPEPIITNITSLDPPMNEFSRFLAFPPLTTYGKH